MPTHDNHFFWVLAATNLRDDVGGCCIGQSRGCHVELEPQLVPHVYEPLHPLSVLDGDRCRRNPGRIIRVPKGSSMR